jgi:hypothetical protein
MPSDRLRDELPNHQQSALARFVLARLVERARKRRDESTSQPIRIRIRVHKPKPAANAPAADPPSALPSDNADLGADLLRRIPRQRRRNEQTHDD